MKKVMIGLGIAAAVILVPVLLVAFNIVVEIFQAVLWGAGIAFVLGFFAFMAFRRKTSA